MLVFCVCGHGSRGFQCGLQWKHWQWATVFTIPWLHYISSSRRQGGVDSFVRVQSTLWKDNGLFLSVCHSNELVHHLCGERVGPMDGGMLMGRRAEECPSIRHHNHSLARATAPSNLLKTFFINVCTLGLGKLSAPRDTCTAVLYLKYLFSCFNLDDTILCSG